VAGGIKASMASVLPGPPVLAAIPLEPSVLKGIPPGLPALPFILPELPVLPAIPLEPLARRCVRQ